MKTTHKIIIGDSRSMTELENSSVHLIITSPPYWQLKDYGTKNQIGYDDSYENYINNMNLVWQECYRVLHNGCRLCVNIGDHFSRSVYYGRYKVIPIRTEIIKFCETIGFDYMGAIIWQKVTTSNTTGGATIMGSYPYPRNGIIKIDYEFILIFKKSGTAPTVTSQQKKLSILTKDEWNSFFQGHWNFAGARQDSHMAMFPDELPRRLIKMFSFVSDTILDPFLGSGTTSSVAKNLDRNSIGYEINPEFLSTIKEKIGMNQQSMFNKASFEIINQNNQNTDFQERISKLKYIFQDPHKMDKKVDLKKLQYGSKIDKNKPERVEYYSVKEIISPELIKLNNDVTVRLIGVKENANAYSSAKEFLSTKTKGQKVFLKFDNIKYDNQNHLMCYLYLKNKTFLNAHLIKERLTDVDIQFEFKYKEKFLKISNGYTND